MQNVYSTSCKCTFNVYNLFFEHAWDKNKTFEVIGIPALSRMFWAEGCQWTMQARLMWETSSTTGSVRFRVSPPSGICHTFTVQSSEQLAMTSSLWGQKEISSTGPLWPSTTGWFISTRPVYKQNVTSSF